MTNCLRAVSLLVVLALGGVVAGCSNHAPVAVKATVETFYSGIAEDDSGNIQDNLAPAASQAFQQHVTAAAATAQHDAAVLKSVQLVQIGAPSIHGDRAQVHVVFADGQSDTVTLVREGLMWKVLASGRLA
jgi:hypothetical protein